MKAGWTLENIDWAQFDASKVDSETLEAVKAAAMVEYNAADYVRYLNQIFAGDETMLADLTRWGEEETQHGLALGRWAELADPGFDFEAAFARFRAGYRPEHFETGEAVRGSRAGELIARCVVESGTSSYYSGIRDTTEEPVLKAIAAHIAADEFRHYKLFYEGFLKYQSKERLSFWKRLKVALGRMKEGEDDELAYAYYCGTVQSAEETQIPYERERFSKEYNRRILRFYKLQNVKRMVQMVAKAVGLHPQGVVVRSATQLLWWGLRLRTRGLKPAAA